MAQHKDLQLLRALAAPEQHDQLKQPADDDVPSDKPKDNLQKTGRPTLSRHQQGLSHTDHRGADRVSAPHGLHTGPAPTGSRAPKQVLQPSLAG